MRYDRDLRHGGRGRPPSAGELVGRGEYGAEYEAPYRAGFHGYATTSHWLRSRGSYGAGELRSGLNPVDEFEFEWGEGYVGGRGYGGTNYDYEHGYRVGSNLRRALPPERPVAELRAPVTATRGVSSAATRGGYSWSEREAGAAYGPARYGYGPYFERLRRRRRSDDEIRSEVEETLFYDTWVDADRITVEVKDGIVTLKGTLPSYDEVRYAVDDAWDVEGVLGVRSELRVEEPAGGGRPGEGRREAKEAEFWAEPSHAAGEGEGEAWAGRELTEAPAAAKAEAVGGERKRARATRGRTAGGRTKKAEGKAARGDEAAAAEGSGGAGGGEQR